jgi:hypothetical protein
VVVPSEKGFAYPLLRQTRAFGLVSAHADFRQMFRGRSGADRLCRQRTRWLDPCPMSAVVTPPSTTSRPPRPSAGCATPARQLAYPLLPSAAALSRRMNGQAMMAVAYAATRGVTAGIATIFRSNNQPA